jgi:Neuraminidase (sialidase)
MVSTIIKLLGTESSVNASGNTFNGNQLIRVYNSNGSDVVISVVDADSNTTGSFTLRSYETAYVRKMPAEKVCAATACKMVAVAF